MTVSVNDRRLAVARGGSMPSDADETKWGLTCLRRCTTATGMSPVRRAIGVPTRFLDVVDRVNFGGRQSRRAGLSLIEMMAAITISAVMMGTCATLVVKLRYLSTSEMNDAQSFSVRIDVARQFRNDVHRATSAEVTGEDGSTLVLMGAGDSVRYDLQNQVLVRQVGDAHAQRTVVDGFDIQWVVADGIARLDGQRADDESSPPWRVDAALSLATTGVAE